MIVVLVDKMIRTQIVDCAAVANWLFSQDMAHEFTRWDVEAFILDIFPLELRAGDARSVFYLPLKRPCSLV